MRLISDMTATEIQSALEQIGLSDMRADPRENTHTHEDPLTFGFGLRVTVWFDGSDTVDRIEVGLPDRHAITLNGDMPVSAWAALFSSRILPDIVASAVGRTRSEIRMLDVKATRLEAAAERYATEVQ